MITLVSTKSESIQTYIGMPSENIFAVRIKSLILAYGQYDNLIDVWCQTDEQDTVTAYLLKYGNEIIADIIHLYDIAEIRNFCTMTGAKILLCRRIGSESYCGTVMKLKKLQENMCQYPCSCEVDLREYYRLLDSNRSEHFAVPDFENFYVDLHHRLKKQCAEIMGVYFHGRLISCCVATAVSGNSAVISAVATLPACQKQGFGTKAVYELCRQLINRGIDNIYLQRDKKKYFGFYHSIGFEDISEFEQTALGI